MQNTRLQAIAQAVCRRQERYQRHTLLFDQLARLLVQGRPVAPELLARLLHSELDEVRAILQVHPELEYDEYGNLVGSGLTLVSTTHQLQVGQRTLFAWCAFDTLTYPMELHLSVQVTSRCPVTGDSIQLTVTPQKVLDLDPGEAQVSLVVDVAAECCSNVREDVCNYGHFFASREAATRWQAAHPQVVILSVEEAYQVGKLVEGPLLRDAEPQASWSESQLFFNR
jgi:alkylmercury lyase